MVKPIPKWLQIRYSKLLIIGNKEFDFDKANRILKDKERIVSIVLSELKKAGWLEITRLDPKDSRKRFYKLKDVRRIFSELK